MDWRALHHLKPAVIARSRRLGEALDPPRSDVFLCDGPPRPIELHHCLAGVVPRVAGHRLTARRVADGIARTDADHQVIHGFGPLGFGCARVSRFGRWPWSRLVLKVYFKWWCKQIAIVHGICLCEVGTIPNYTSRLSNKILYILLTPRYRVEIQQIIGAAHIRPGSTNRAIEVALAIRAEPTTLFNCRLFYAIGPRIGEPPSPRGSASRTQTAHTLPRIRRRDRMSPAIHSAFDQTPSTRAGRTKDGMILSAGLNHRFLHTMEGRAQIRGRASHAR